MSTNSAFGSFAQILAQAFAIPLVAPIITVLIYQPIKRRDIAELKAGSRY